MPRPQKGRVDQLAPDRISTDLLLDELKSKIQLAEYEHKATFAKSEQEKKTNFITLLSARKKNKSRLSTHTTAADSHNIAFAYEKGRPNEKLFVCRKSMTDAIQIQDNKVCEAIKKYNLKASEKEEKMKEVKELTDELKLLQKQEQKAYDDINSPEKQQIRVLENRFEKLKMKQRSAQLINEQYHKILQQLKDDTQNYPWKLDQLEVELVEHQTEYAVAVDINHKSQNMVERSIQGTKKFHEEYFESKKNRDKILGNTRKKVDKSHKEVKGSDKTKGVKAGAHNPMQQIINKEAEQAQATQQKYEKQRKKRVDYESTASFLKNACKVSSKEEILPAITQQHEIQRALRLQIDSLESQKAVLLLEKNGVTSEYQNLKYYGEKRVSEGVRRMEEEASAVGELKQKLKEVTTNIRKKDELLNEVNMASNNFFMILQKYKIDPMARQQMVGNISQDMAIIMEKLEEVCADIEPHGKVAEFLENTEFLDFMEDTLPKANTRVDVRFDDEESADVFEEESTKISSTVLGREEIKKASQKIIEKHQGKQRRKKIK